MRKTVSLCIFGALACAPFAVAQTQEQTESQSSTGMSQSQSGQSGAIQQSPRVQRSRAAAGMLNYVQQARQDIAQHNRQAAMNQVNQAIQDLNQAESMQASGATTASANIVPIYQELEQTSVIGPLEAARGSSARQGAAERSGQTGTEQNTMAEATQGQSTESQSTGMAERSGTAPVVKSVEGGYTAVAVDLKMAKDHLLAAKTALQNNQTAQADSALAAVQSGVMLVSVQRDLPLVRARENLALAQQMAQNGNVSAASAPLQAAVNSLEEYQRMNQGTSQNLSQIAQLQQQISSYSSSIQQQDPSQASATIGNWWNEVSDITDRMLAQNQGQTPGQSQYQQQTTPQQQQPMEQEPPMQEQQQEEQSPQEQQQTTPPPQA